jgi:murein DD-endopeptidase MepM/ murein hydrolase activator NlpD
MSQFIGGAAEPAGSARGARTGWRIALLLVAGWLASAGTSRGVGRMPLRPSLGPGDGAPAAVEIVRAEVDPAPAVVVSYDVAALLQNARERAEVTGAEWTEFLARSERLAATPLIKPTTGIVSSSFSRTRRHPIAEVERPHQGIDIAAPAGTPIMAPARGVVRYAGDRGGGYGRVVELDHGHGVITRFAHASRILVQDGQHVERGQVIAEVGSTGLSTGPHLHYEVLLDGRQVDPTPFLRTTGAPADGARYGRAVQP